MFGIVLVYFQVNDKVGWARVFSKTFFVANTNIEIIRGIYFLVFSNAKVLFAEREFIWRSYTLAKALSTIKQVQVIDHKKFEAVTLDLSKEVFVVYVAYLSKKISIYPD